MRGDPPSPRFPSPVEEGVFLRRSNRFLVECRLGRRIVQAYLPNPGRELDGRPVLLHTHHTNTAAHWLLENELVPGLRGWKVARREVAHKGSRFDFLLHRRDMRMLLEVKSCTLFGKRIAMFPDAVTARGRRHLLELAAAAGEGTEAGVLFLIHWPGAEFFLPEYHTDPDFSRALSQVRRRVMITALGLRWSRDLTLSPQVRKVEIPWAVLGREDHDRGSYVVVLRLSRPLKIHTGGLGKVHYRKGYYLYVGSAASGLRKRTERHRRVAGRPHWHIDYLRESAEMVGILPVRSADRLECRLAEALGKLARWSVPGFGSSDCRCPSHLFATPEDPFALPEFADLVLHFRIDRLLEEKETASLFRSGKSHGG